MPEAVAVVLRFAFDQLGLHRVEAAIVPRNARSRRVAEKLGMRDEGTSERFLQIRGVWEDHVRYAITAEEWSARKRELEGAFLAG
jgi:ribosomal-protein-alanine N-acetyltransferase